MLDNCPCECNSTVCRTGNQGPQRPHRVRLQPSGQHRAGPGAEQRLEVKAGVDPLAVKREFGDRLVLYGGFNALLWDNVEEMEAAVRRNLPVLMEGGGYVFATDHSTPSSVNLQDFRRIVHVVKDVGRY